MSLVTSSHQSGEHVQVSFDKEALKLISKVSNHPLLSNEANWEMVTIVYKHESSGKRLVSGIKNDFSKTDDVRVKSDMSGGEVYELYKILISGQDRTPILSIKRDEIANASSMDLTLASNSGGGGSGSSGYIVWDTLLSSGAPISTAGEPYIVEADGGLANGPGDGTWVKASQNSISGSSTGDFDFVIDGYIFSNGFAFGLAKDAMDTHVGFYFFRPNLRFQGNFIALVDPSLSSFTNGGTAYVDGPRVQDQPSWNPSGPNTLRVRIQNGICKLYVNGVEFVTNSQAISIDPNGTYYPVARIYATGENNGIVSASKV